MFICLHPVEEVITQYSSQHMFPICLVIEFFFQNFENTRNFFSIICTLSRLFYRVWLIFYMVNELQLNRFSWSKLRFSWFKFKLKCVKMSGTCNILTIIYEEWICWGSYFFLLFLKGVKVTWLLKFFFLASNCYSMSTHTFLSHLKKSV